MDNITKFVLACQKPYSNKVDPTPLGYAARFADAMSRPEKSSGLAKAGDKKKKANGDPDEDDPDIDPKEIIVKPGKGSEDDTANDDEDESTGKNKKSSDDDDDGDGDSPDNDNDGDGNEPKDGEKTCPACGGSGIQKDDAEGDVNSADRRNGMGPAQSDNRAKFARLNATTATNPMLKKFCDVLGDEEGKRQFAKGRSFEEALLSRIAFLSEALDSTGLEFRKQLQAKNAKISAMTSDLGKANQRVFSLSQELHENKAKLATFSRQNPLTRL